MIINVSPIYGNGWTNKAVSIDEPAPFQVETDVRSIVERFHGVVTTQGHVFNGYSFEAYLRNRDEYNIYNCLLNGQTLQTVGARDQVIYGYCYIEDENSDLSER